MPHKDWEMDFKDFRIHKIEFRVNEKFKPKNKPIVINTSLKIDHKYNKRKKELKVLIEVSQNEIDAPFSYVVEGIGIFHFIKEPDEQQLVRIASINCPAILFPYIREAVADMTRRSGFGPLHLSPINFVKLAEEAKKSRPIQ